MIVRVYKEMKNSHKTQRKSFKRFHRTQNVKVSKFSYFFRKKIFLEFPAPVHARETRILNFFKLELLESNNCFFYTQFSYMYIHVCFHVDVKEISKTVTKHFFVKLDHSQNI